MEKKPTGVIELPIDWLNDDNAYFDRSFGLNLTYTWDKNGRGTDLSGNCSATGYLGYAYLETPGNSYDAQDNDQDGIVDEQRDGSAGDLIVGRDNIRAQVQTRYTLAAFESFYGPLESRPAYRAGRWWTGDENLNWVADYDDVGGDGLRERLDAPQDGLTGGLVERDLLGRHAATPLRE